MDSKTEAPKDYPRCKYSLNNMQGVIVQNAAEEKALGPKWFDHPSDAQAGRVLNNVERGGGTPDDAHPVAGVVPYIVTQPKGLTVNAGQTATFVVESRSATPVTYQWKKNKVAIQGATSSSYSTAPVSAADDGTDYSVVVTSPSGSVTSEIAELTVKG
jgi:hypothetical protein